MKKLFSLILVLLLLTGCAPSRKAPEGMTITDDLGRTVTVASTERTAALLGSYADIWMLAGGTVCATADDAWDDLGLPLDGAVNLGGVKSLSLEALLGCEPTLVLASTNTAQHLEWQGTLEGAGIPVAYFDVANFEDYLRMLKICTDLLGTPERYEQYGSAIAPVVEEAKAHAAQRVAAQGETSVLVLRASASSIRAKNSQGNVLGEILHDLGCLNIADSDSGLLEALSMESILALNPDAIFIVQSGDDTEGTLANIEAMFRDDPAWDSMDAVAQGRVYLVDKQLYNLKPNARWGEAYAHLEDLLSGQE